MNLNELMQKQVDRLQELRQRKERALKSGSPNSEIENLDMNIYSCEDAIAMYETSLREKMEKCNLGKRFQTRTFKNFDETKQEEAYRECLDAAERIADGESDSLLLSGGVGTGKTHLAAAIAHYAIERGVITKFGNVTDIFQSLRDAFTTDEDILSEVKSVPLLVLDDLGKEKHSEWSTETIYSIVNYRYEHMLPTVITTNMTVEELQDRVGSATMSRLMEMCRYVEMNGEDYRI